MIQISNLSELTATAIEEFRKAVGKPMDINRVSKTINQGTGLTAYDLQAPAKQLFPVLTPLRNSIPRVSGGGGDATNWKAVTAINTANLRGFVPEGKRNGVVATTVVPKSAGYKSLGLEDLVTFEANLASKGFEDVRSTTAQRLLWATMIEEELSLLGANNGVVLGTPTAPTVTASNDGTIANGTYNVAVVALTLFGLLASSLANGAVGLVSVTNPVGSTFTYGGGSSDKSGVTSTGALAATTNSISASTPVVPGAVAYAWYVGAAGAERLQAITTINSVKLTSLATTTQLLSAITADNSKNDLAYDGILYQAWATNSGAYIKALATGTAGTGTPLTTDNAGGIVEIDEMLAYMWDTLKLSPTTIYVNAQEAGSITKKVLGGTGINYNLVSQNPGDGMRNLTAGAIVAKYLNKFAQGVNPEIPIKVHPYMPKGTLMAPTEVLPYPITNVSNVMEVRLRQDYYQIDWPQRERQYESGVYCDGVLAHYFPPSIGIITNIAKG